MLRGFESHRFLQMKKAWCRSELGKLLERAINTEALLDERSGDRKEAYLKRIAERLARTGRIDAWGMTRDKSVIKLRVSKHNDYVDVIVNDALVFSPC